MKSLVTCGRTARAQRGRQLIKPGHRALALGCALALWPRAALGMTCSIESITSLAFGSYDVFNGTPTDTGGSLSYRCDSVVGGDSIVIQLSQGSSGSYAPRTMKDGLFVLEYNVYLDAAHSSVWGDGTGGTSQLGPVQPANGASTPVDVYGRIEPGQNARPGTYADTLVVTLVF